MMLFELGKPNISGAAPIKGGRKISNQRVTVVLEMMFSLQECGSFSRTQLMSHLNISRSTFFRALSDLRCYLQEHRPYLELYLDPQNETYVFVDPRKG